MRLLWVFPSFEIGGSQRRFATLANGLAADGMGGEFQHNIVSLSGEQGAMALLAPGVQASLIDVSAAKSRGLSLRNIKAFAKVLDDVRSDILLTANWGSIEWHLANRGKRACPHIHFEDGFGADESINARRFTRDITRRIVFSLTKNTRPTAFVAPSRELASVFTTAWGASPDNVHFIQNGIDMDAFPMDNRASRASVTIGSVGALRAEKRIDRLIRVFAMLENKNARLLIVGDGPERDNLERLARELGVSQRVSFAGLQTDVASYYGQMDVFALTSDTEQMPISLIEAMATGLPVIATRVGDVPVMLGSQSESFIVPPSDEAGFANSLSRLVGDAGKRESLGRNNAHTARARFSHAAMLDTYRNLFEELAARGRG